MANSHSSINENERYEKLCARGMSRVKAARMTHSNNDGEVWRGGKFSKYQKWTTDELYKKAVEMGIDGCSHMNKQALINALREH